MNVDDYKNYKNKFLDILQNEKELKDEYLNKYIQDLKSAIGTMPNCVYRYRTISEYSLLEILYQNIFLSRIDDFDDILDSHYVYNPFGKHYLNEDPFVFHHKGNNLSKEVNNKYRKRLRVASLTQSYVNIPMWYYYAAKHKGICIKYLVKDFGIEDIFLPVIYPKMREASEYHFYPTDKQINIGAVFSALVKNEDWKFEKEWRIIRCGDSLPDKLYVNWKIDTIYYGIDTPEQYKILIKNFIEKNNLDIDLLEMQMTAQGLRSKPYAQKESY